MSRLDALIAALSPRWAVDRARNRRILAVYEAGQSTELRKFSTSEASGNVLTKAYSRPIRNQARNLDRNHDLSRGALNVLVNNIVGPSGISTEPQPRDKNTGSIHIELAGQLSDLWRDWSRYPEVTYQMNWAAAQRMACRSWLRDGEIFAQVIAGITPNLDHRTRVPLSIELLEADFVPFDAEDGNRLRQGIVQNAWGQPVAYQVYKMHPGDNWYMASNSMLKTIDAANMLHVKLTDRVGQLRGVSIFASVITRLEDIKDYEESERIAAKIAASMAAFIKKGAPDLYAETKDANGNAVPRNLRFQPGMIFDDLMPGEEIGTIDTSRPNSNLQTHRDGQLRAAAAGFGASYSSLSRNYNGTYSAQRQELVEQWVHYQALAEQFTAQFIQPVWERFVLMARASGRLNQAWLNECAPETIDDALHVTQAMPWIDPEKEAQAMQLLEQNVYMSGPEIIRRRGANPQTVIDQQEKWVAQKKAAGLNQPVAAANQAPASQNTPSPQGA